MNDQPQAAIGGNILQLIAAVVGVNGLAGPRMRHPS
jgi:hypothetical protein